MVCDRVCKCCSFLCVRNTPSTPVHTMPSLLFYRFGRELSFDTYAIALFFLLCSLFRRERPPCSFHESVQLHEPGYAKWLRTHAPGSLDGSDLAQARETFSKWPLLQHGELEYVDTPAGVSQEKTASVEAFARRLASKAGFTNRCRRISLVAKRLPVLAYPSSN